MWIILSFGGMGLMAAMLLLFVPAGRAGVNPAVVLFYCTTIASACSFIYLKLQRIPLRVSRTALLWMLCAAVAGFLGNLCYLMAIFIAPNPGYPGAIEGSKMLIVTLASVWLFASHFSLRKGLGALCCAIGVALICL